MWKIALTLLVLLGCKPAEDQAPPPAPSPAPRVDAPTDMAPRGQPSQVPSDAPNARTLDCDALLAAQDIKEVCSADVVLAATSMEGTPLSPCNRRASGSFNFIVSRLKSERGAQAAAKVATGPMAAVATAGNYLVEVKSRDYLGKKAQCTEAQLATLAARAAKRIGSP